MENKDIENTVMNKIKNGQVKFRSRYIFLAEKLGLGTAFTFTVVLSVLFFNLILFYMKETDNLRYLSFGKFGFLAFLESFPYLLVVAFIILIVLSGYLITKSDISYKKPFGYLSVALILSIMVFGGVLTYTNIAERIERGTQGDHPFAKAFKPFMWGGVDARDRGVAGIIIKTSSDYLIIETPQGLRKIDLSKINDSIVLEKGNFIIAVGYNQGRDFVAQKIRIVDKNDMPVMRDRIDNQFSPFLENNKPLPSSLLYFEKADQDCMKNCFNNKLNLDQCFNACHK